MSFQKDKKYETISYLVLWGLLFIAPVLGLYIRSTHNGTGYIEWQEVYIIWRHIGIFFAIFLIHNHLLAPMLIYQQRKWLYSSALIVLMAFFVVYECSNIPSFKREHRMHEPPPFHHEDRHPGPPPEFKKHHHDENTPIVLIAQPEVVTFILMVLMLMANLGIKLYFKNQRDRERLLELQSQNLEQQLEYLKYQIKPHFLMNTLNNIHALVDIDAELAKSTIIELSKILRFMLYEGNKQTVPLESEINFLKSYIQLMKLRVSDQVRVKVEMPDQLPDIQIPPLMLITFVENAFKHGVSYSRPSFIDIQLTVNEKELVFICHNSKAPQSQIGSKPGGVGLKNIRQRLNLIYGKDYQLKINNNNEEYHLSLTLPL